jgi:hypothetical protein
METISAPLFWTLVLYSLSFPLLCILLAFGLARSHARRLLLQRRFKGVTDKDAEIARLEGEHQDELKRLGEATEAAKAEIAALQQSYKDKHATYEKLLKQIAVYDEGVAYAELGVYAPHFELGDSTAFRDAIGKIREQQKAMVASEQAVFTNKPQPLEPGKSESAQTRALKLTLRAFNGEADAAIANVRWSTIAAMEQRIIRAREQFDRLNAPYAIFVNSDYVALKLQELYLTHEYREKLKDEADQRAEVSRRLGAEVRLKRDLELAQEDVTRFAKLLSQAQLEASKYVGGRLKTFTDQISGLERELAAAEAKVTRARSMLERTQSGYVYVLSNVGSFGEEVVKIGTTRRLDPSELVRELGLDAVPFAFDSHALIHTRDAGSLERSLHVAFAEQRVNPRRPGSEFFRVPLRDVEAAVRRLVPDAVFTLEAEARDFRETLASRHQQPPEALLASLLPASL